MQSTPFAAFEHYQAWLEVSLIGQALLRWNALLCLDGGLPWPSPSGCASACRTSQGGSRARDGRNDLAAAAPLAVGRSARRRFPLAAGAARGEPIEAPRLPNTVILRTLAGLVTNGGRSFRQ
jgi:hypothetical protein